MLNSTLGRFLGVCVALASVSAAPQPAQDGQLFNGRNFQGWRYYLQSHEVGMRAVWSVQDGNIVCKGEPMGYIYTTRPYKNFHLTLEWRWAPGTKPGNSGVLFRINGKPQPLPRSLEAQLQSGNAGDLYGFHGMKVTGDAARSKSGKGELFGELVGVGKISGNEKEPGEWNTYDILVHEDTIKVSVNGKVVNEATTPDILAGPIGLQSEGGEIHFRNIRISEVRE